MLEYGHIIYAYIRALDAFGLGAGNSHANKDSFLVHGKVFHTVRITSATLLASGSMLHAATERPLPKKVLGTQNSAFIVGLRAFSVCRIFPISLPFIYG